ncbi:MAG: PBSX family phage terminase large subunit [Oscillospiraceae bacterium]|nr:PBSX family phage terminase large subunit [Oscillospiraceae bacterium]
MNKKGYTTFSQKQLTVLTWWHEASPYRNYDALICDGAVRSGKTTCMSISFVAWAFYRFQDTSFAICGKTIASLKRNIALPLISALRELGFECKEKMSQHLIEVSFGGKTNRFYLFGGRDESSASLIQGMTLGGVLLDEVALMPRSFVEQALARCSLEGSKFWFNCNPENPMHWFYEEWIQKAEEKNCLYLHFLMKDNPSLGSDIIRRYENLYSGTFYERFILGKWVAVDGLVYPEVASGKYIEKPPCLSFDKHYISCDYGTVNPTSMGLWGLTGDLWYRFDEFYYSSRQQGRQLTDEEYYTRLEDFAAGRAIEAVIIDPSAASFIACIRRHGKFRVIPAKNDVTDGIRKVHEAFKQGRILISPVCKDSIKEFSLYRWDQGAAKDTPKKENDHAMDEIRYFVSSVLSQEKDGFFVLSAERSP